MYSHSLNQIETTLIQNLNVPKENYFNNVVFQIDTTIYVLIIHKTGILKYDLHNNQVMESFNAPKTLCNISLYNECCLDDNKGIVYIDDFIKKKIITFNLLSKKWNYNFYDYDKKNYPTVLNGLYFFLNESVKFNITEYNVENINGWYQSFAHSVFEFRINGIGVEIIQKKKIQDQFSYYDQWKLYFYKCKLYELPIIKVNKIMVTLFENKYKKRQYKHLIHCQLVWNQIIFFVFKNLTQQEYSYTLDCVDIFDITHVYWEVLFLPNEAIDILHISKQTAILYYINIKQQEHNQLHLWDHLPDDIIKNNKFIKMQKLIQICSYYYKTTNSKIPIDLTNLILKFCPLFI